MHDIPGEIIVKFKKRVLDTEARDIIEEFFELTVKEFIPTQDGNLYCIAVDQGREEAMILGFKRLSTIVIDAKRNYTTTSLKTT
ncbi:MAG: hypothetical protein HYT27_03515 [Parcubacteria group bacterium]|nr:hypothetical protein [Parcubacteria group bacterium]